MYVCVYVCVCVFMCVHLCLCVYVYVFYVCKSMFFYVRVYVHMFECMCMSVCVCVSACWAVCLCVSVYLCMCMGVRGSVYVCACVCVCVWVCVLMHAHVYVCMSGFVYTCVYVSKENGLVMLLCFNGISTFVGYFMPKLCGPPHMANQKQDGLLEHKYSSYVMIRDVTLKTCQRWWMIGRRGERGSGISVIAARHDDDDDPCKRTTEVLFNPQLSGGKIRVFILFPRALI